MDGVTAHVSHVINSHAADENDHTGSLPDHAVHAIARSEAGHTTDVFGHPTGPTQPFRVLRFDRGGINPPNDGTAATTAAATSSVPSVVTNGAGPGETRTAPTTPASSQRRRPIVLGQTTVVTTPTDWKRLGLFMVGLGVFVWVLLAFLASSDDTQRVAKRLEESAREVAKQEARVAVLRTQVAYLGTDAYIEVAAREKLGLVKPGDHPVIILPEVDDVAWVPAAPPERPTGPFGPRYGRLDDWVRLFFGNADEGILGKPS